MMARISITYINDRATNRSNTLCDKSARTLRLGTTWFDALSHGYSGQSEIHFPFWPKLQHHSQNWIWSPPSEALKTAGAASSSSPVAVDTTTGGDPPSQKRSDRAKRIEQQVQQERVENRMIQLSLIGTFMSEISPPVTWWALLPKIWTLGLWTRISTIFWVHHLLSLEALFPTFVKLFDSTMSVSISVV